MPHCFQTAITWQSLLCEVFQRCYRALHISELHPPSPLSAQGKGLGVGLTGFLQKVLHDPGATPVTDLMSALINIKIAHSGGKGERGDGSPPLGSCGVPPAARANRHVSFVLQSRVNTLLSSHTYLG